MRPATPANGVGYTNRRPGERCLMRHSYPCSGHRGVQLADLAVEIGAVVGVAGVSRVDRVDEAEAAPVRPDHPGSAAGALPHVAGDAVAAPVAPPGDALAVGQPVAAVLGRGPARVAKDGRRQAALLVPGEALAAGHLGDAAPVPRLHHEDADVVAHVAGRAQLLSTVQARAVHSP